MYEENTAGPATFMSAVLTSTLSTHIKRTGTGPYTVLLASSHSQGHLLAHLAYLCRERSLLTDGFVTVVTAVQL